MIDKSAVTQLASEGYHTLQIPQISIDLTGAGNSEDHTDFDNEYVIPLSGTGKSRIAAGREIQNAFMFLSRKGWNHYKNDIQAAFTPNRGTWQEFETKAEAFLDEVETYTLKELVKVQALNSVTPTKARLKKEQDFIKFLARM